MITTEDWFDFVCQFFGVEDKLLRHITTNWNHTLKQSGCGCKFEDGQIIECDIYKDLRYHERHPDET